MIEKLINKMENKLKKLSPNWTLNCFYSMYEDLLLINYCKDESKLDSLYRDINRIISKNFCNSKSKYILEDKEEYTQDERTQIIKNVGIVFKSELK